MCSTPSPKTGERGLSLTLLFALFIASGAFAQRANFDILKGDDVIGSIAASRTERGDRTNYVMTSYAVMHLLWERRVRTEMIAEYEGDSLRACMSSVHVNGSVRDSSRMTPDDPGLLCYVHQRGSFHRTSAHPWTTARMYFEEPVGQTHVFVESVLQPCSIQPGEPGAYLLTFPDGAQNRYVYEGGELQEIHVDRTFLDLVFRRREDVQR